MLIISIKSQALRSLAGEIAAFGAKDKKIVLCMKGLEENTGKRLTEIMLEEGYDKNNIAVWVGPGHIQEFTAGSRIRLMPDIHAGAGGTIGTTMTITDKVVPNLVGVDIGCGMETTRIREGRLELQKLDKLIYEKIPSGFSIRDKAHRYLNEIDLSELCCARHVDLLRAEKSIGTLGGGNHFIEVDKDDEGNLYIVVHSGSRHLGVEVASYYQEAGYKVLNRTDDASLQTLVAQMKAEGREKEIQKELKKL